MRIAILTNAYPPKARGGAGHIASVYTRVLESCGHEVRVWHAKKSFQSLSKMNTFSRLLFHVLDVQADQKTVDEMKTWKPDVLMTHNLTGCGFGTVRVVTDMGIPWFHVLHDVQLFEPSGQMLFGEKYIFLRKVWRRVWGAVRVRAMNVPTGIISPTQWLVDMHHVHGVYRRVPSIIIPNPIEYSPIVQSQRDVRSLIFVGRVDADKGAGVLLAAWPFLRESATRLVIIGDGKWRAAFELLKDEKIQVRGELSHTEVLKAMSESEVVLVPSLVMENQPTVILEGFAMGCQVIASDVGGVKETLNGRGTIIPPNNVHALVDACTKVFNTALRDLDKKRIQELLEIHSINVVIKRMEQLLKPRK